MNEYQLRDLKTYEESARRLRLIVDELNALELEDVTTFEMQPTPEDYDFTPRFICVDALTEAGKIELICERDGYGSKGRWEFRASGWPTYTDENGSTCTSDSSNLWNPSEPRPTTTAQQDRDPKAIAKQIASKILPEYLRIYARCVERNDDMQKHSDVRADGLRRLAEACKDTGHQNGRARSSFYIQGLPGDTVSVDSNSHGDVQVRLGTDEMIKVIALLRELRA
jgi:hypothetical protein